MEYEYVSQVFNQLQNYGFNIDKFIDDLKNMLIQKLNSEITCVTYNVLRTNSMENLKEISKILISLNPDIIALQEVSENFYYYIASNGYFTQHYSFIKPDTFDLDYPDGEMLLIKEKFKPIFYQPYPLPYTNQHRYLICAQISINNKSFMIGTAHIESVFSNQMAINIKCHQLMEIGHILNNVKTDGAIFMGDINLTGGNSYR